MTNPLFPPTAVFPPIEWQQLRTALALLAGAAVLGGVWMYGARQYTLAMDDARQKQQQELTHLQSLYRETEQTVAILQQSYQTFQDLQRRHFLGDSQEQRLNWMTQINQLGQQFKLSHFTFTISPRQEYLIPENTAQDRAFHAYASEMKLEMDVLHEDELLAVLAALERPDMAGIPWVRQCVLTQKSDSHALSPQANLRAACTVILYTAEIIE